MMLEYHIDVLLHVDPITCIHTMEVIACDQLEAREVECVACGVHAYGMLKHPLEHGDETSLIDVSMRVRMVFMQPCHHVDP